MGDVEYFELCETQYFIVYLIVQKALFSAHVEIAYATLQAPAESKSIRCFVDFASCDLKKKWPHGARHGKSEEQTYYHQAYKAWKRCRKTKDGHRSTLHRISRLILEGSAVPSVTRRTWVGRSKI